MESYEPQTDGEALTVFGGNTESSALLFRLQISNCRDDILASNWKYGLFRSGFWT